MIVSEKQSEKKDITKGHPHKPQPTAHGKQ